MTRSRRLLVAAASLTLALGVAVPASTTASAAPDKTTSSSTDSPRPYNPNRDDDSVKNPGCDETLYSNSDNGPKSQDQPNTGCETAPAAAPAPVQVAAVQAATVEPEPVDLLPCDGVISTDGKGVHPDVSITRMKDADEAAANYCDPFPYELKSVPGGLRFVKPTGYEWSQFILDVTWHRTLEQLDDPTTVDFEAFKEPYPVVISDCPDFLRDPETGDFVGLTVTPGTTAADLALLGIVDQDGFPSVDNPADNGLTQFACVINTETQFQPWAEGGPRWDVFQKIWLLGDVFFRG